MMVHKNKENGNPFIRTTERIIDNFAYKGKGK